MVAAKMANLKNGQIGNGRKVGPSNEGATSVESASKLLDVSISTVERARRVLANGSQALIDA